MDHQTFAQLLGNYGEFFGAIGLIFSLIFVGTEIRQSRNLAVVEGVERRNDGWNEFSRLLLTNPDLRQVFRNGGQDLDSLGADEKFIYHQLMFLRYTLLVRQFYRGVKLKDQEALEGAKGILLEQFSDEPSLADWWQQHWLEWRPAFRNFVDEALTEHEKGKT
jgi:hypothetical protein